MTKTELLAYLHSDISEFTFMPVSKVIDLVEEIEEIQETETPKGSISSEDFDDIMDDLESHVHNSVDRNAEDCVDLGSAEFYLSGNEIQLESVNVDSCEIASIAMNAIREKLYTLLVKEEEAEG